MILRYISLNLDRKIFGNDYGYDFLLHTRFISNYFSKAIRKHKYQTDGSFNMISIDGSHDIVSPKIVPMTALKITLEFDKEKYARIRGTTNCDYYLELLENGFKQADKFKPIPLDVLLGLIKEFKRNDCKNEWLHKKKRFNEHDLEVILTCEFTTNYFKLMATINQISTKKELIKGAVITTEPDEVLFDKMFKDILLNDNDIIITDASDTPRVLINKKDAFLSKLTFEITGGDKIKKALSFVSQLV
jgi:hypothetical protein